MLRCASLLLAGLMGCRGTPLYGVAEEPFFCDPRELEAGEVRVWRVSCDAELLPGGEGRRSDWILENVDVRYLFRTPASAFSVPGFGGGSLIDASDGPTEDPVFDVIPLLAGRSWFLDPVSSWTQHEGSAELALEGLLAPLPRLGGNPEAGLEGRLTWRLEAGGIVLDAEGAEGLLVVPEAGANLHGPLLVSPGGLALGVDGDPEDLGGAVLFEEAHRLAVGAAADVMAALWPGGPEISGTSNGEGIELLRGGRVVGWLPVEAGGSWSGRAPEAVDGVRAIAEGFAPGETLPPGEGLQLGVGAEGGLSLRVGDAASRDLAARLDAEDASGARSSYAIPPGGLRVPLAPGSWDLVVSAGPLSDRLVLDAFDVPPDEPLEVLLASRGAPPGWILADLDARTWPGWTHRASPSEALALRAAEGAAFVVLTADDEVAGGQADPPWTESLRVRAGSATLTDGLGEILSWPWTANAKKAGHGAIPWEGLDAQDLLAVARGGSQRDRLLVIEADWALAAGPPWSWDPLPDAFRLRGFGDLALYLDLLGRYADLAAVGPWTWLQVEDADTFGAVEAERALVESRSVASSGPLIELGAWSAGPGDSVSGGTPETRLRIRVRAPPWVPLDGAALYIDGVETARWDLREARGELRLDTMRFESPRRFVVAVAWADGDPGPPARGAPWAVTSPIWFGGP